MSNGNEHPDGWIAQLPDDLKSNEALTGFEKIGDFANAYLEQGKAKTELDGKLANSIQLLKDDATDEEKADFFNKIGRPEAPDKYELKDPELPEEYKYPEYVQQSFRLAAHKEGLTKQQAENLYDWFYRDIISRNIVAESERRKEVFDEFKKEWGADFERNKQVADRLIMQIEKEGVPGLFKYLTEGQWDHDPYLIKAFHIIGEKILEDTTPPGTPPGGKGLKATPDGKSAAEEKVLEYPSMEK